MLSKASRLCLFFAVIFFMLAFSFQSLHAQPLWGEEGVVPVWFNTSANFYRDIVHYENGNHGVVVVVDELVPGPDSSRFAEMIFDSNGNFLDSVRYPVEMRNAYVASVVGLADGSRLIGFEARDYGPNGIVFQNADGTTGWVWECPVAASNSGPERNRIFTINDYVLFLFEAYPGFNLYAVWLDIDSGAEIGYVQLTDTESGRFGVRVAEDSIRIAVDSYTYSDAGYQEIQLETGGENFVISTLSELRDYNSRSFYYSCYLLRVHNATEDYSYAYEIYDESHVLHDSGAFPADDVCFNEFTGIDGRIIGVNAESVTAFEFGEGSLESVWSNSFSDVNCCFMDEDGGAILSSEGNDQMRRVRPDGTTQWTADRDWTIFEYNQLVYVGPSVICSYSGHIQYRVNASTGALIETNSIFDLDQGRLQDWRLVPSGQEYSWLVFEEQDYDVFPAEYRPTIRRLSADGTVNPDDDYISDYLIYPSTCLTAGPDGGVWMLTRDGQTCLDCNGDPVFEAQETPFDYNYILYFNPGEDIAPYHILYRSVQNNTTHTINQVRLDADGNSVGDPEYLFSLPVSDNYPDMSTFRDAVHLMDDLLVYAVGSGRPTVYSCLGVYDTIREENTVLDTLHEGMPLDVYTDGQQYYSVSYRMNDEPGYPNPCSGALVLTHTLFAAPQFEDVELLDSIPGTVYGFNDILLEDCKARAFFSDKMLYTVSLDSGLNWNVRQYTFEGELLNGPVALQAEPTDSIAAFLKSEPEGCWVVLGQKAYLLDQDLSFSEGYEQGICFSSWENVTYEEPQAVQTSDGNLVVAGNEGIYLILAQCFEGLEPEVNVDQKAAHVLPAQFTLAAPWPNPFNSTTRLRYSLPHAGEVRLAVYDILGREVRELANATQQAGQYEVHWDGCSDAGIGVASGVYFVRAELGEQQLVKKVTLVK